MIRLTLLTVVGTVHHAGGLNWGFSQNAHVSKLDAYIPIHIQTIRDNLNFFKNRDITSNTVLTFIWDDGVHMNGLFEGTQHNSEDGLNYPKQISSHPHKNILGKYLRDRLGVPYDRPVTLQDLKNYGRDSVDITFLSDKTYYMDFSV